MGVRGLTTFFNQNPDFFKPYKLHDSLVIVDGDNLIHALYFNNRINFMYGGDYKKYADFVRRYLLAYLECNIKPIIVFDGGYDKSGRKLKTISNRAKQRLEQVKHIANGGSCYERILPILARAVFMSVLVELDIIFAVCDYEADDQITALANYYQCPVISADSDFYIYDLHKGFIRLDTVDITVIFDIDSDGKKYSYLCCNIYHIDEFVCYFPGINKDVLPLFGALMGNDYVEAKEFDNFFSNIKLPKYKGRKLILNAKQRKMIGLLCWLKNYTLDGAINQVTQYLKKDKREYIKSVIEIAICGYKLHSSNLSQIIDKKLYDIDREICLSNQLTFPCGKSLPSDFVLKFHIGLYSSFFINVIVSRKVFLNVQMEEINFASSYAGSRYIRKIIYGILIGHDDCQNGKCLNAYIEENDRHGTKFRKELVEPIYSLEGFGVLPKVNELNELKKEQSLSILTTVLGVHSDFLVNVPEEWQLLIGCCNYWLGNCNPQCTESFLYALIINFIYFSLIHHSIARKNKYVCPNSEPAESVCTCSTIKCIISKIKETELEKAKLKLKKYGYQPLVNRGNPLLMHIIHSYSQLQSCIIDATILNKLLGNCLQNITPHTCFSGTMLYNLAKDISNRSNPKLFVGEILGRETNLYALFCSLNSTICRDAPFACKLKDELPLQKVKKHKTKSLENDHLRNKKDTHVLKSFDILNRKEIL